MRRLELDGGSLAVKEALTFQKMSDVDVAFERRE